MFHPLINLLLTFTLIILLLRKKVAMGWVMLAAALLLGILFQVSPTDQLLVLKQAVLSQVFLQLGVALNIIIFLEHILRTKGYLNKTLNSLAVLIPNPKVNIAILPAFLGLLPSPGGAVFSAPLVEEAGQTLTMDAEDKSLVNYWFRHVWEYFMPLYPGTILVAEILGVPVGRVAAILFGFFFAVILIGFGLIIRKIPKNSTANSPVRAVNGSPKQALLELIAGIWPVAVIVLLVLFFHWDVGLTVAGVIVLLLFLNRYRRAELAQLWQEGFKLSLVYLIAGILIFKEMLQASGVVEWLPQYLKSLGVPDLAVVIALPFLVAFAVGITQAYVAATFPLLIGIIGHGAGVKPGMLILAFISGFVGLMLSPMHLCFVLTVDYFKANFLKVWLSLLVPEAILLTIAIIAGLLWR